MHTSTSANEYADAVWRRGRVVPQRSLPPCGGGTGRGVATNTEREARLVHRLATMGGCIYRVATWNRCSACCTPLPVPPPQGGREPWGTHLRNSSNVSADGLPEMCACPSAQAGTHNHRRFSSISTTPYRLDTAYGSPPARGRRRVC